MTALDCLTKTGLNLDAAVLLAEACQAAYGPVQQQGAEWAGGKGFTASVGHDQGNIQLFWAESPDVALLVFRGTSNPGQWIRDLRIAPAIHPWGLVHRGFSTGVKVVEDALLRFAATAKGKKHVWITGHSLGGALAALVGANLKREGILTTIYTYGQPRLGYWNFSDRFDHELSGRLYRFINQADIVARLPPGLFFKHSAIPKRIVMPGVLEATGDVLPFAPAMPDAAYTLNQRIGLESGEPPPFANPLLKLTDGDVPAISEQDFLMLQLQLGMASETCEEDGNLEGGTSSEGLFADHAISQYIKLLAQIRDAQPNP